MEQETTTVLCIEDDEDNCELITFLFNQEGYQVEACGQKDCLKLIHEKKFSAIILDNYFDGLSGIDICREIKIITPSTPVIFFSGEARKTEIEKAIDAGANAYLVKPNDLEKLLPVTNKFIEKSQSSIQS